MFRKIFLLLAVCALFVTCKSPEDGVPVSGNGYAYTVTFDKNGGTAEANPQSKTVTPPATTIDALPAPPTRANYAFTGWNTQPDGSGAAFTALTVITASITVYAQWLYAPPGSFIVSFHRNGGDTDAAPVSKVITPPATTIDALPAPPIRANYTFTGWNTQQNGSGAAFTAATTVTTSITVYAQWEYTPVNPPDGEKLNGAALTGPLTAAERTYYSITINAVTAPANGQLVEYAIAATNSAPSTAWQAGLFFYGLSANTHYYVFARAKENDTYKAGPAISAQIATEAAQIIPTIVTFENDAVNKTYDSAKGGNAPTVTVITDPVYAGQKSLRISSTGYNQAAIVPINLPYALNNYKSFTFRYNPTSGTFGSQQVYVYIANAANAFLQYGFGNDPKGTGNNTSNYPEFAANLLGTASPNHAKTNQWTEYTITVTNPGNAIKDLKGNVFLAIGINHDSSITYLFDDLTFTVKDNFVPPPPPPPGPTPPSVGAVASGTYRNLFKELGKTDAQIDAKVNAAWNQLFVNGTADQKIFVEVDSDMAYILDSGNNDVRSEGMSYGMMMAVQLNDKARFDKLWKWAHTHMYNDRNVNNTGKNVRGFFAWQCNTNGSKKDDAPAPDGEFYFVTALLFASARWGDGSGINEYGRYARYILYDMLHREPGVKDNYGAIPMINSTHKLPEFTTVTAQHTDPSYILPAFYDVWAIEIENGSSYWNIWGGESAARTDAAYWREVAAAGRAFFPKTVNAVTGLGPDYAQYNGSPGSHGDFEYDAWRIAMNIGFDYAWWAKDPWQKTQSDRIQTFFHNQGVESYGNRYSLSGNKLGSDHSPGLVACNAVATLAATQAITWDFVENLWNISTTTGQYRYYDGCLYMMGLLHVSGKFKAYLSSGSNVTPSSAISPTTAAFDKNTAGANYKDITVTMTLNGNTLSNIKNGNTALSSPAAYTVSGSTVTIKKEYLAQQANGTTTLTFTFSAGSARTIAITIGDTTGGGPIGGAVTSYNFSTDSPSVTSSSNTTAVISNGVLVVDRSGGYGSPSQIMIPFNLGGTTLGSYSKLRLVIKAVSGGDWTSKGFQVGASSDGTVWTDIATTNTNNWSTSFQTIDVNISGASGLTGAIFIRLQWDQSNAVTYEIQSIGLVQ